MDNQSGNTHPQLKKIKRPINRSTPQSASRVEVNSNPFKTDNQSERKSHTETANDKPDIDRYLDDADLPSTEIRQGLTNDNSSQSPQYIDEEAYEEEVYGRSRYVSSLPDWLTMKVFFLILSVSLFVGMVAGKFIFGESKVVRNGLQGVIVNAEVPRGRARCGVAERAQGCVLYIMNPQRQDMRAKDFYDLASQMTGRQRFMIETGNMRYANSKIGPGEIVQLNIPPL